MRYTSRYVSAEIVRPPKPPEPEMIVRLELPASLARKLRSALNNEPALYEVFHAIGEVLRAEKML